MTRWRQGQSLPHHVYRQLGDEPDTTPWPGGDPPVATFFDPDDALRAVEAVNGALTEDSIGIRAERDALRDELHHETQRRDDLIAELRRQQDALLRQVEHLRAQRPDETLRFAAREVVRYAREIEHGSSMHRLMLAVQVGNAGRPVHPDPDPVILTSPAGYTLTEQVQAVWDEEGPDGVADAIRRVARGEGSARVSVPSDSLLAVEIAARNLFRAICHEYDEQGETFPVRVSLCMNGLREALGEEYPPMTREAT